MKPTNEMKLAFESRSQNESFARVAVAAFIAQLDPTVDELAEKMKMTAEEIRDIMKVALDAVNVETAAKMNLDGADGPAPEEE